MFKYISQILAQFTRAQRILALVIVLLAIVIISLAPSYISTITMDRSELETKIRNQEIRIRSLESQIDTLDYRIRTGREDCTNEILAREQEFLIMLDELRGDMLKYKGIKKKDIRPIMVDSLVVSERRVMILPEEPSFNPKPMINKIDKMKSKIIKNK